MKSQTVTTREELKMAKENGVDEIIIQGELANKLKKAKAITKLGAVGLGVLTVVLGASVVTAPVTGGLSFLQLRQLPQSQAWEQPQSSLHPHSELGLLSRFLRDMKKLSSPMVK